MFRYVCVFILIFALVSLPLNAKIIPVYPQENQIIQTTTPTLQWKDDTKSFGYRVTVWQAENVKSKTFTQQAATTTTTSFTLHAVYLTSTKKNEVAVPDGILKKGKTYVWQVKPIIPNNRLKIPPYFRFTIAAPNTQPQNPTPFTAPVNAPIVFDFNSLGQNLSLQVSGTSAIFPDGLISPKGEQKASISNGILKFRFDLAKPIDFSNPNLAVKLDNGTTLKIGYDIKSLGKFQKMYDVGFDLYRDTPNFDNYTGVNFLDKGGTCLGMVFTVKNFYENVDYGTDKGVNILKVKPMDVLKVILKKKRFCAPDSKDMREFSIKHKDKLKKIMSFNHLDNLNPRVLDDSLKSVFNLDDDRKIFADFRNTLAKGELPLLAMYQVKEEKSFKIPIINKTIKFRISYAGHAMLVYRIYEFAKKSLMCIYDPNILYRPDRPFHTYITYEAEKKHGAFKYHAEKGSSYDQFASKYKAFFLMPSSKLLFSLSGILADSWDKINNFINDIVQKVTNFVNPIISKVTEKLKSIKIKWPF